MPRPLLELVGCKRFSWVPTGELFLAKDQNDQPLSYDISDPEKRKALLASVDDKGRNYFREVIYEGAPETPEVERTKVEVRRGRPPKIKKGGDTRSVDDEPKKKVKEAPIETDDGVEF